MSKPRPSLLERAAEIYDFASGLPLGTGDRELPPPSARPVRQAEPPAPRAAAPAAVPEGTEARAPVRRLAEPARPVAHARVALDPGILTRQGFITPDAPPTALAEEMRLIKRRLLSAIDRRAERGDPRARIVLVASGQPGDGKTFMAANLALSIAAEPDRSVLLIDGDSGKPDLMDRLGLEERPGFVDALADHGQDPERLVLVSDIGRLALLPAGRRERNVPELIASARAQDVLERLVTADPDRIILIDSPPVLAASPATALAALAGQVLIVVRADATSESDLKETIDLLSPCEQLLLVLNSTAFQVGRRFGKYEEYL